MKTTHRAFFYSAAAAAVLGTAGYAFNVMASRHPDPAPARPALTVSTETPQFADLPMRLAAHGSIAAWQEASVGAEVSGLRLAAVHVNVGDPVRRGQVLATFASDTPQAELAQMQASLAEAEAAAGDAAANAQRARTLDATGALSAQQIAQYLTAEQTARAKVDAQRAAVQAQQLRLAKTRVLAPDDGVISARNATVGAVLSGGQELFRLIRGGRLEWRAEVTAAESVRLRPGTAVRVTAADGSAIEGRVRVIAPSVDPNTRNGLVYVDLPASAALKAGMFAEGEFELGRSGALTVPQQAVVVRDGYSYVFRVDGERRVVQTRVTIGRRVGQRVEVLDGIQPGTRLVARGAGFLTDGDLVKVAAATGPHGPPAIH